MGWVASFETHLGVWALGSEKRRKRGCVLTTDRKTEARQSTCSRAGCLGPLGNRTRCWGRGRPLPDEGGCPFAPSRPLGQAGGLLPADGLRLEEAGRQALQLAVEAGRVSLWQRKRLLVSSNGQMMLSWGQLWGKEKGKTA
jgi:hypothetical protein